MTPKIDEEKGYMTYLDPAQLDQVLREANLELTKEEREDFDSDFEEMLIAELPAVMIRIAKSVMVEKYSDRLEVLPDDAWEGGEDEDLIKDDDDDDREPAFEDD